MKILKILRKKKNFTQGKLAELLGVSIGTVGNYETGLREPDFETLKKISAIFNVSIDDLVKENLQFNEKKIGIRIPVLGTIPAGIPIEAIEEILDYEEISEELARTGEFFALRVKGDSMAPRINDKDIVIIKKQDTVFNNEIAAVLVNGHDATLKRVRFEKNGITLIPDNEIYGPMFYSAEQVQSLPIRIIGKAVEVRGKL